MRVGKADLGAILLSFFFPARQAVWMCARRVAKSVLTFFIHSCFYSRTDAGCIIESANRKAVRERCD